MRVYCIAELFQLPTVAGWTSNDCPDEVQLRNLGDNMKQSIFNVHDKSYTSQKSIDLYKTTGTASDWSVYR